jgi:chromosome condensin MukBEF MukE localization factor
MCSEKIFTDVGEVLRNFVCEEARLQDDGGLATHEVLDEYLMSFGQDREVLVVSNESLGGKLDGKNMLAPKSVDQFVRGNVSFKF